MKKIQNQHHLWQLISILKNLKNNHMMENIKLPQQQDGG
jgi:hypothetical protein